jgi:uncharacterized membrane protein
MSKRTQMRIAIVASAVLLSSIAPLRAEESVEKAGVAVGLTVGNVLFVPLKAMSAAMGAISGALSFVLMGGDDEVTKQVWRDTLPGPYVITPELAKKAIGERPELDLE